MAAQMGTRLGRALPAIVLAAATLAAVGLGRHGSFSETALGQTSDGEDKDETQRATIDPLGPNAACYVCHIPFVREELARVHLAEKVTCIECHGLSAAHANDEDVGATKPDIVYPRAKIDASCRKCHETHDAPAAAVIARFIERDITDTAPVCTDCHGTHRIQRPEDEEE